MLQADFNHTDPLGWLRLGDLRMHLHKTFDAIAANQERLIFVDGEDLVRGELVDDPQLGWVGQVDWSTQDVWEAYPTAAVRG
jgi:hypothetical protein